MSDSLAELPVYSIESRILLIRGHKVLLDADLAELYGVPTKVFNQAVKRNRLRFPEDSCSGSRSKKDGAWNL